MRTQFWLGEIALMMEVPSTSETSVNFYQTTGRNKTEDRHLQTYLMFKHEIILTYQLLKVLVEWNDVTSDIIYRHSVAWRYLFELNDCLATEHQGTLYFDALIL
jgi:hypothetical protein